MIVATGKVTMATVVAEQYSQANRGFLDKAFSM